MVIEAMVLINVDIKVSNGYDNGMVMEAIIVMLLVIVTIVMTEVNIVV